MLYDIALLITGLALLVIAGDALVRGAVALSLELGVSALVVSLTVVAFGTSAPELLISIRATLDGATGLVFGNIVGSNIANVLLVLGVPAIIAPIHVAQRGLRRNYAMMIAASILFIAVCGYGGLQFNIGVAFLALLGAILFNAYLMAKQTPAGAADFEPESEPGATPAWRIAALLAVGLVGLPLGAGLLIDGGRAIALDFGVSEAAIGLTLIALGTSLPELATTVMAALRRQADVAVGNVVGSNLFNILAVAGGAALFGDLPTPPGFLELDLWIMLGASLAMAPFILMKRDIGKVFGIAFIAAYIVYVILALGPRM